MLSHRLTLQEWSRQDVVLAPASVERLESEFGHALEITPRGGDRYRARATSFVGSIVLPDLEIRILPKCGTRNLFWMLAWAYGLAEHHPELVDVEEVEDLREFLLSVLTEQVERLVRRGIRSGYVEQNDDLPSLRGRLDFDRHLRQQQRADLRLPCRFEEYTDDLSMNQAIAHTLRTVGGSEHPLLSLRLRRLRLALAHLSRRSFKGTDIADFEYDRLTESYRPIHALCRILLDARGGESGEGELPIGSLLVNMNMVFEKFVAAWLMFHMPAPWSLRTQASGSLDVAGRLPIVPDLVVFRDGEPVVVADTKYKMRTRGTPHSTDAYQALAYCRALGVKRCVLLYPDVERSHRFVVVDGENEIVADGLRLDGPTEEIEAHAWALMRRLLAEPMTTRAA